MAKQTIIIFSAGYFPGVGYGGPVTSISNLVETFGRQYDIYIVTSNHDLHSRDVYSGIDEGWNEVGLAKVLYLNDSDYTVRRFADIISGFSDPVIYLSGVFNHRLNYPAIVAAHKCGARIIVAPRGELCANAIHLKCGKKRLYIFIMLLRGLFRLPTVYQATSYEEFDAIQKWLKVDSGKISLVPNIPRQMNKRVKSEKIEGELRLVFVSRIQPKKNLAELIAAANVLEYSTEVDIYGPIEDSAYWDRCKKGMAEASQNVKYRYCGVASYDEVTSLYGKYDYFVLPTVSENYGHVIAEALQAGCPVIVPKGVTPWDSVNKTAGFTYPLGNVGALTNILRGCARQGQCDHQRLVDSTNKYSTKVLRYDDLRNQYIELFGE